MFAKVLILDEFWYNRFLIEIICPVLAGYWGLQHFTPLRSLYDLLVMKLNFNTNEVGFLAF